MPELEIPIEVPSVEGMRGEAATIVKWLRKEGDEVRKGDPVVLLEFPKVELEVLSPASGKISSISAKEGRMVRVGDSVGSIQT